VREAATVSCPAGDARRDDEVCSEQRRIEREREKERAC